MTQHRRRQFLWALNILLVAALAAVTASAFLPLPETAQAEPGRREAPVPVADETPPVPPLSAYQSVYARDLRKPLFDVKPTVVKPKPKTPKTPAKPLLIRLTGTVVEPGNSFGVFLVLGNRTQLAGVGETIENAQVIEITDTSAKLLHEGREITLEVEEGPAAPGHTPRAPARRPRTRVRTRRSEELD